MKKILSIVLVAFMASNAWSGAYAYDNMKDCLVASHAYCNENKCKIPSQIWCKNHIKESIPDG